MELDVSSVLHLLCFKSWAEQNRKIKQLANYFSRCVCDSLIIMSYHESSLSFKSILSNGLTFPRSPCHWLLFCDSILGSNVIGMGVSLILGSISEVLCVCVLPCVLLCQMLCDVSVISLVVSLVNVFCFNFALN